MSWGRALAIGMKIEDVEDWPERIARVTADQVTIAARRILSAPGQVELQLLPAEGGGIMMRVLFLVFAVLQLAGCAKEPSFDSPVGEPVIGLQIEEVVSPSGITAWLVRDDSLPITAIQFQFQDAGAVTDPEGLEGLADMASSLIDEGAGPLDSQAFQQRLNDLSITLRFSAGREGFGGTLYSLNRYRDDAVEMLRLALNEPRFDAEPVERIRAQIQAGLRSRAQNPRAIAGEKLMRDLFSGSCLWPACRRHGAIGRRDQGGGSAPVC